MFIYKKWASVKTVFGVEKERKEYGVLLFMGIIPLWISING